MSIKPLAGYCAVRIGSFYRVYSSLRMPPPAWKRRLKNRTVVIDAAGEHDDFQPWLGLTYQFQRTTPYTDSKAASG